MNTAKKQVRAPKKDEPVKLNMNFEQAMKKALNTPLPVKKTAKKK